jgi:hypothetical protein
MQYDRDVPRSLPVWNGKRIGEWWQLIDDSNSVFFSFKTPADEWNFGWQTANDILAVRRRYAVPFELCLLSCSSGRSAAHLSPSRSGLQTVRINTESARRS